ncbi:MAG: potassium transporter Trk [Synergistes sp.]|nr:potassium transporter Trk [Synergistes sp.]
MLFHTSYKVEKVILTGFLLVILAGALLLWAVNNYICGLPLSPLDALFMATSGVCVTGLGTVDISSGFGTEAQLILLALIQIGGLGFMTAMVMLSVALRKRLGLREQIFFTGGLGVEGLHGALSLFFTVICFTALFEAVGAVALFISFASCGESLPDSAYLAFFHSISAFCNAGFSPCSGGLRNYASVPSVTAVIMLLITIGGIGFPVCSECMERVTSGPPYKLSVYTKLVLIISGVLVAAGTVLFALSEWNGAFAEFSAPLKLWNALFASVTARTAGFETVPSGNLTELGMAIMIILMTIGASPSSTGGGAKTTTFGVLAISVWNELHGRDVPSFMKRTIPERTERRAISLLAIYFFTILIAVLLLGVTEKGFPFRAVIFEAASALGTVGLTVGITDKLSVFGKMIIIVLMFWGRVGIYSFVSTLIRADNNTGVRYPETHIPIG